jgi:hypothetical protein
MNAVLGAYVRNDPNKRVARKTIRAETKARSIRVTKTKARTGTKVVKAEEPMRRAAKAAKRR